MSRTIDLLTVKIGADMHELLSGFDRVSTRAEKLGRQMTSVGRKLTVGVTLPLAGAAAAATKAAVDWETAMIGVAKTVDASAEELDALGDALVRMSERVPVAAGELAGIAAEAGQLGIATKNLRGFVETVAGLRVATNLGEEAGSTLARLANIMGTAQTDFDRMGSTIVELGNNLATTEAEIADMGLRIAGAGRQIGLTEAQVLSFAGALSSVGVRSEAGGTAISRVMVDIATAAEKGGESLEQFASVAGVSAEEFRDRFETDAAGAVTAFIVGLGDLEAQGRSTFGTLEKLGLADIRVRDVLLRAAGASELFTEALVRGSAAWEENTALAREADLFFNRLGARFEKLKNKAANLTAEFGDALRPAIDKVIAGIDTTLDVIRQLVQRFAALDPHVRTQVALWGGFVAALGPALVVLGTLAVTVRTLTTAVAAFNVAMLAGPVGWIVGGALAVGLIAVAAGFRKMARAAKEVGEETAPSLEELKAQLADARSRMERFGRAAKAAGDTALGRNFQRQARAAHAEYVQLSGAIQTAELALRETDDAADDVTPTVRTLAQGVASLTGRIKEVTIGAINPMTGALVTLEDRIQASFDRSRVERWSAAIARAGEIFEATRTPLERYEETMKELNRLLEMGAISQDTFTRAAEMAARMLEVATDSMRRLKDAIGDTALEGVDAFVDFASGAGDAMSQFAKRAIKDLAKLVARMLFIRGIMKFLPSVGGFLGFDRFAGGFASGGHIPAGQFGLVGEAGPEIVSSPSFVQGPANVTPMGGGLSGADVLAAVGPAPSYASPEVAATTDYYRRLISAAWPDLKSRGGGR